MSDFEARVTRLNKEKKERIQGFLLDAVGNCVANAGYVFLDPNGPKWDKIAEETPIVWRLEATNFFRLHGSGSIFLSNAKR